MRKLLLAFFGVIPLVMHAQTDSSLIRKHIYFLADDALEGRGTATAGERKAAEYIAEQFKSYKLKPKGEGKSYFQSYSFRETDPKNPHGSMDSALPKVETRNVEAYLDNGKPFTVIFGAHYDHLGRGERFGSLDKDAKGQIHNGADDNASGVSGLLELARHYSSNKYKEPYNMLFIAFSGEELGLYGSKSFCEKPTIDLQHVHIMINMDMIGRLDESDYKLAISGTGTSPVLQDLLLTLQNPPIKIKTDSSGMGPSDHTSFYLKDIPVLHFFTGTHTDYHKPSDDADKINIAGEQMVLNYIVQVTDSLMKLPKLRFTATRNNSTANAPRFKVTLGVIPDYMYEGEGVKLDGVSEGKPAFKAGIQKDDVILQIGGLPTMSMMEYMKALSVFEKGDSTTVKLKRGEEIKEIEITF